MCMYIQAYGAIAVLITQVQCGSLCDLYIYKPFLYFFITFTYVIKQGTYRLDNFHPMFSHVYRTAACKFKQ